MSLNTKNTATSLTPQDMSGSTKVRFANKTFWFLFPLKYTAEYTLRYYHVERTGSTNDLALTLPAPAGNEIAVVAADDQTAGRGQGKNVWVSEPGKNLAFSFVCRADFLKPAEQFRLLQAEALAVRHVLGKLCDNVKIKWPNDIYIGDCKVSGTLIQCVIEHNAILRAVIGTGVNVNQREFGGLPNPVSLAAAVGHDIDRDELLQAIAARFAVEYEGLRYNSDVIRQRYALHLYRREGIHPYRDKHGRFEAEIVRVEPDGHLTLRDTAGLLRSYAFKEVEMEGI